MRHVLMVATLSLMAANSAFAQSAPPAQEFVTMAASAGQYEILSSQMIDGDAKAGAEVKTFADQMIADHTKASTDLATAAKASGLVVKDQLAPKHKAMIDELGAATDKTPLYLKQQTMAHQEAVTLHETYAAKGEDAALKTYATATLPVLKQHLEHVQMLQGGAGAMTTGSTTGDAMPAGMMGTTTAAPATAN